MVEIQFDFDWDPVKAEENRRKHGVSFERAATVFLDPLAMAMVDEEHSYGELRWITQGRTAEGELLVVVHTHHEINQNTAAVRLISARPATRRERQRYEGSP